MVNNAPILRHVHDGLTIEGYSRAAVQTCWRLNELKVLFDVGIQPWDFMGIPTAFITHAHLDHIAALPAYVSRRRMMKMDPPVIYLPDSAVDAAWDMLQTFKKLDRGAMPCELIGLLPGDQIDISREYVLTALPTTHTIDSVGFVIHQRRNKLKPEFQHLDGPQIKALKLAGEEITSEIRIPVIAYTGDTSPKGLDDNPVFFEAKTLIAEMTFVAPEHRKEKIHKHGHMHVDDFRKRQDEFKNELIIASHLSTRYNTHQVKKFVSKALPDALGGRLKLWI
ncbi:MAG: MBL fold metallo-hydrolase [Rubripirellula sp.]